MPTIKNVRIESHEDDFSGAYTQVHEIILSDKFSEMITKASNFTWSFNRDYPDAGARMIFVTPIEDVKCETIGIHSVTVSDEGFTFECTDCFNTIGETEELPYEALKMERFLLYDSGDEAYEYKDGEDFELEDFDIYYANSIEEATFNCFAKSLEDALLVKPDTL